MQALSRWDALPWDDSEYLTVTNKLTNIPLQKLTSRWFATPSPLFAGGSDYIRMFTHTRCLKIMLHRDNNRSLYKSSNIVFLSHARALPSYKNNCHKMQFCHLKTFYFKMNTSVEGKTAYNNVLLLKSKRLAWCLFKGWIYAQKWLTYKLSIKIQLQGLQSNISLNKLYTTVTIYLQFWSPCQKVTEG